MKHLRLRVNTEPWYDCTRPTAPGNTYTEYNQRLVVTSPEIKNIRQLEVAHYRTAFLLREAGLWILVCVFPTMMQQQQHSSDKEYT